jgi:hypothetical protein
MMDTDDDRDVGPAEHLHDNRSSQLAAHGHHVQYGFKRIHRPVKSELVDTLVVRDDQLSLTATASLDV